MSLSDYTIIKLIGKGSYGEVHLVQQKKERKQVGAICTSNFAQYWLVYC